MLIAHTICSVSLQSVPSTEPGFSQDFFPPPEKNAFFTTVTYGLLRWTHSIFNVTELMKSLFSTIDALKPNRTVSASLNHCFHYICRPFVLSAIKKNKCDDGC